MLKKAYKIAKMSVCRINLILEIIKVKASKLDDNSRKLSIQFMFVLECLQASLITKAILKPQP